MWGARNARSATSEAAGAAVVAQRILGGIEYVNIPFLPTWYINKYSVTLTNISAYLAVAPGPTHPAVAHVHTELGYARS